MTGPIANGKGPNLFIVGAAKAGTTSLHAYLAQHPDVFMSPVKEPHYYSRVRPSAEQRAIMRHVVSEEAEYRLLFEGSEGFRVVGEASPSYLWEQGTAPRLAESHPDARIVAILRDPVERAFSHYLMDLKLGVQSLPFLQAVEVDEKQEEKGWGVSHLYLELGFYGEQLERYFANFPTEKLLVLTFDELTGNRIETIARLLEFLDLEPADAGRFDLDEVHNRFAAPRGWLARRMLSSDLVRSVGDRLPRTFRRAVRRRVLERHGVDKPTMADDVRSYLRSRYDADTRRLEQLLGRRMPWSQR